MNRQYLIWSIIAVTGVVDAILIVADGMTIGSYWPQVIFALCMCGLSIIFLRIPSISLLLVSIAQICSFSLVGGYLTYAALAASPFPMVDALLSRADGALGFDWLAWFGWVNAHPKLHFVLAHAYASCPIQIFGLLLYFSYADAGRVHEFILAGMLSVIIIVPIMVLLPAVGEPSHHVGGVNERWAHDILALRSHTLLVIAQTDGIIFFPSFHTVLGVLFANMARGQNWFLPMIVLNLLMIASVMSEGAHYAVDMLSGLVVAFVALGATRFLLGRCQPVPRACLSTIQPYQIL